MTGTHVSPFLDIPTRFAPERGENLRKGNCQGRQWQMVFNLFIKSKSMTSAKKPISSLWIWKSFPPKKLPTFCWWSILMKHTSNHWVVRVVTSKVPFKMSWFWIRRNGPWCGETQIFFESPDWGRFFPARNIHTVMVKRSLNSYRGLFW